MTSDMQERRRRALPALRQSVERILAKRLGWESAEPEIEIASGGSSSLVYFIRPEGHAPVVVHGFSTPGVAAQLLRAHAMAERHHVPVPRVLAATVGPFGWRRGKFNWVVSEMVPGNILPKDGALPEHLEPMAISLAALHRPRSRRWGDFKRLRRSSILRRWGEALDHRLDRVANQVEGEERDRVRHWQSLLHEHRRGLAEPKVFHLCHHHLGYDDMLFDPDTGKVWIIDCLDLKFSRPSRDLGVVKQVLFENSPERWHTFLDLYLMHTGDDEASLVSEIFFHEGLFLAGKLRRAFEREESRDWVTRRLDDLMERMTSPTR